MRWRRFSLRRLPRGPGQAPRAPFLVHFPSGPLRIIVPFPPGGGTDILARPLAQKLNERFKQPVVIENRGGANGTIGTGYVAKTAPADGLVQLVGVRRGIALDHRLQHRLGQGLAGAGEGLLDSYTAERRPIAQRNLADSSKATEFITPKSVHSLALHDAVLNLAKVAPFAQRYVNTGRFAVWPVASLRF